MIPATACYEASYRHESDGRSHFSTRPVIAWDDDGAALVPDMKTGRLCSADSWANFAGLRRADVPLVGVTPGDGWHAEVKTDTGDTEFRPILAWTLDAEGALTPFTVDSDGLTGDATRLENFIRLCEPSEIR